MTRRRHASPEPHWGCSMSTKLYGLIPRKQGMGRDEIHDYYRRPHRPLGPNMTTKRGYVTTPQSDTDRPGPDQARHADDAAPAARRVREGGVRPGRIRGAR